MLKRIYKEIQSKSIINFILLYTTNFLFFFLRGERKIICIIKLSTIYRAIIGALNRILSNHLFTHFRLSYFFLTGKNKIGGDDLWSFP